MKKPKSNIKRIRAIEGSLSLSILAFLSFKLLSLLLKNIPLKEFENILWGASILFLSSFFGFSLGIFLNYLYSLLDNFFNDFFNDAKFRKAILIILIAFLTIPFLISFGFVLFSKPLEDIRNIMAIIAYSITIIVGIITIIIKIKKNKKSKN